MYFVQPIHTI